MDDETTVAPTLQRLSAKFEGSVGIGSYPVSLRLGLQIVFNKALMNLSIVLVQMVDGDSTEIN